MATPSDTVIHVLWIMVASETPIHTMALRCQIQIEPASRRYADAEGDRLYDLFGDRARWHDTLRPLPWTTVPVLTPRFERRIEIDLPVSCTYDLEVSSARYFHALEGGEIPLRFLVGDPLPRIC